MNIYNVVRSHNHYGVTSYKCGPLRTLYIFPFNSECGYLNGASSIALGASDIEEVFKKKSETIGYILRCTVANRMKPLFFRAF